MNLEKVLDIRFLAPVGIMVFFVFLSSPGSFLFWILSLSKVSWLVSTIGVLGIGFMISSITEFFIRCAGGYVDKKENKLKLELNKIFPHSEEGTQKTPGRELLSWITLDLENQGVEGRSSIPDQIHKRWNMAMANFNSATATILGKIIGCILLLTGTFEFPGFLWCFIYVGVFGFFLAIFLVNGENARRSVLEMNNLLVARNQSQLENPESRWKKDQKPTGLSV